MTTFAPYPDLSARLLELDERERHAWDTYADTLRDLDGGEYDAAEPEAWDGLQRELADVRERRSELQPDPPRS